MRCAGGVSGFPVDGDQAVNEPDDVFGMPSALDIAAAAPEQATTVACEVTRVIDGDTIEVEVKQRYRVRLLDCWAPEMRGETKYAGVYSKSNLVEAVEVYGEEATLSVPWSVNAAESWSMGRVLGNVWLKGCPDKSLSELQVESGHATKTKPNE